LIEHLAERAASAGWRLFLLGTAPRTVAAVAGALAERHPGLMIAGTHAGSPAGDEEDAIVGSIRQAQPTMLLVGFGMPQQEKWIARNLPRLGVPVVMGVGAALERMADGITPPSITADLRNRLRRLWALAQLAASVWLGGR
jgi:N-acetylglucosaminyldiphosphoundecaprenol N-acetyl-beta-D-mannosaminyltransferase